MISQEVTRASQQRKRERDEEKERNKYEEDYFVRTQGKKRQRVEGMTETIDDLLDFGSGRKSIRDHKKRRGKVRETRAKVHLLQPHTGW